MNPTEAGEGLKDRSLATIIIDPTQAPPAAPAAPAPAGVRPVSATAPDEGKVVPAGGVQAPASQPPAAFPTTPPVGPRVNPPPGLPFGYK
jgi:hypothetical protein